MPPLGWALSRWVGLASLPRAAWLPRPLSTLTGVCADVLQLLHHWVEQLAGFQLVLASSSPPACRGRRVEEANGGREWLAEFLIQQFDLPPLMGLQLRDLLHVPARQV